MAKNIDSIVYKIAGYHGHFKYYIVSLSATMPLLFAHPFLSFSSPPIAWPILSIIKKKRYYKILNIKT
jgi:hypothetical protein